MRSSYFTFDFRLASSSSGVMFLVLAQLIGNNKTAKMITSVDFTLASVWLIMVVGFESLDGGGLVVLHETTVTGDVGVEDGGELAVEAFRFHAGTSLARRFGKIQNERGVSKIKSGEV